MKKYFKKQLKTSKFLLEHEDISDFYISCWQNNLSTLPLLCIRAVIFLACLGILITALVINGGDLGFKFWPIFFTHWGIVLITVTSGCALGVSYMAFRKGHVEQLFGLPWFVKAYWALFNITITTAIFITMFYYAFLSALEDIDFAINPVVDVLIHGMNSVLMLALLMTSRHPINILHFYFPFVFSLIYLAFNIIYYYAGGEDPMGNPYIYPNLDWRNPGEAALTCVLSAVVIIVLHNVVVALTLLRDYITRKNKKESLSLNGS